MTLFRCGWRFDRPGIGSPPGDTARLFILEQNQADIEIISTSGAAIGKFLDLIIGDGIEPDAGGIKLGKGALQLDQL